VSNAAPLRLAPDDKETHDGTERPQRPARAGRPQRRRDPDSRPGRLRRGSDAPIGAVARAAGVGISALYRRYPGKEALLATLCLDGLRRFVAIAEQAGEVSDPWESFVAFLRGIVDADVHSLTVYLAGRFTPTPEHRELAVRAGTLADGILHRAQQAGRSAPTWRARTYR
jgi:AcrR family transcriptional regulator